MGNEVYRVVFERIEGEGIGQRIPVVFRDESQLDEYVEKRPWIKVLAKGVSREQSNRLCLNMHLTPEDLGLD